jgi:glyoxylase-like metal-dependent hydrolase (beta-lactamase superfamily II)
MIAAGWDARLLEAGALPFRGADLGPPGEYPERLEIPCNVLLLRREGLTVLVDAGAGVRTAQWPGMREDLPAALAEAGCTPDAVDLLVLTHLDFDHAGGAVDGDGRRAFPNAAATVPTEAAAGARYDPGGSGGALLAAYGDAGRLSEGRDGQEVAPGVVLRDAPGHRAGHSVVDVGGELLHLADTIHDARHVEHPAWDCTYDGDVEVALATRIQVLDDVARRGVPVVASHVRGAGRIGGGEGERRWLPA